MPQKCRNYFAQETTGIPLLQIDNFNIIRAWNGANTCDKLLLGGYKADKVLQLHNRFNFVDAAKAFIEAANMPTWKEPKPQKSALENDDIEALALQQIIQEVKDCQYSPSQLIDFFATLPLDKAVQLA